MVAINFLILSSVKPVHDGIRGFFRNLLFRSGFLRFFVCWSLWVRCVCVCVIPNSGQKLMPHNVYKTLHFQFSFISCLLARLFPSFISLLPSLFCLSVVPSSVAICIILFQALYPPVLRILVSLTWTVAVVATRQMTSWRHASSSLQVSVFVVWFDSRHTVAYQTIQMWTEESELQTKSSVNMI